MSEPRRCATKYCLNDTPKHKRLCYKCRSRLYRVRNKLMATYHTIKSSARQRGISFSLTLEEFKKVCDESGYLSGRGTSPDSLTIDRIRAWDGYQADNIQIITLQANSSKGRKEPRRDPNVSSWPNTPF